LDPREKGDFRALRDQPVVLQLPANPVFPEQKGSEGTTVEDVRMEIPVKREKRQNLAVLVRNDSQQHHIKSL